MLDLVVAHKTTKEVARDLAIAPNTVDQRLKAARQKVAARDRNDLARKYLALLASCGKTTCGLPVIAEPHLASPPAAPESPPQSRFTLHDAGSFPLPAPWETVAEAGLPEMLDRRFGKLWRIMAIPLGALGIALAVGFVLIAISQLLAVLI